MVRLIDADAWKADIDENYVFTGFKELREDVIQSIDAQPTVEVEIVKHGKWIPTHESGLFSHPYSITYVCSECGNKIYTLMGMPQVTEYCSKCGAKMEIIEVSNG